MKKSNILRNISISPSKNSIFEVKKPQKMTTQLSFKNFSQLNQFKKEQSKREQSKVLKMMSPSMAVRNNKYTERQKQNWMDMNTTQTNVSDALYSSEESRLLEILKMERDSLKSTLMMYKTQAECTEEDNKRIKKELTKAKSQLKQKVEEMKELGSQNQELNSKQKQFHNILPKLVELEQLQEKVIEENNQVKNKFKISEAILTNIANISRLGQNNQSSLEMIRSLTEAFYYEKVSKESHRQKSQRS